MSRSRCDHEEEVMGALRTGLWTAELNGHLESCAVCRETKLVAESLVQYAAALRVEQEPGAADRIWRRAQMERQQMDLQRATRPLIFMRALSLGCVAIFTAWLLRAFGQLDYRDWLRGWTGAGGETAGVGAVIAVALVAAGAVYLLREGKRRGVMDGIS
jgi:hypothetical protein